MTRRAVFKDDGTDAFDDGVSPVDIQAAAGVPDPATGSDGDVITVDTGAYILAPSSGAGVDSIAKSGDTPLTGDVTLSEGANVTLTQVGQDIEIAASGTGSTPTGTGFTHNTAGVQDAAAKLVEIADVASSLKPSGTATGTDESLRRLGTGSTHAAAGDDSRFPTAGEKNALAGTSGTPGSLNKYVTDGDSRMTDARTPTAHKTSHEDGGSDEISIQGLAGTSVELANHLADPTAAHAASAISIVDAGGYFAGTEVEAALQELGATGLGIETPAGTIDGSNVTFTLTATPTVPANLLLFKNGLMQDQGVDYTLSGTTITFTTAPATGSTLLAGVPVTIGSVSADIPVDGWTASASTWTYASGSGGGTATFTVAGVDVTAIFEPGVRLRLKQGGAYKYFVVISSAFSTNTTVTITAGSDYTLANAAITDNYYSRVASPAGYPGWFNFATLAAVTGFSPTPTPSFAQFCVNGRMCIISFSVTGTSNATSLTVQAPVASAVANYGFGTCQVTNSGTVAAGPGRMTINSSTITVTRDMTGLAWTNSGTKAAQGCVLMYPI